MSATTVDLSGLSPYLIDFIPDDGRPARELFEDGGGDIDGVLRDILRLASPALPVADTTRRTSAVKEVA